MSRVDLCVKPEVYLESGHIRPSLIPCSLCVCFLRRNTGVVWRSMFCSEQTLMLVHSWSLYGKRSTQTET